MRDGVSRRRQRRRRRRGIVLSAMPPSSALLAPLLLVCSLNSFTALGFSPPRAVRLKTTTPLSGPRPLGGSTPSLEMVGAWIDLDLDRSGGRSRDGEMRANIPPAAIPPVNGVEDQTSTKTAADVDVDVDARDPDKVLFSRALLLLVACLYGTNFSAVKMLGERMDGNVGALLTLRFCLASLATLPWLLKPTPTKAPSGEDDGPRSGDVANGAGDDGMVVGNRDGMDVLSTLGVIMAGLEVGSWNAVGYLGQVIGLGTTDASKSAFICSLAVVLVPALDVLVGKMMPPRKILAAVMAMVGVGLLELGGGDASALSSLGFGDLCSLVQPVGFGIAFWRMEHALRRYPDEAMRLTASQILACALVSAAYCAWGARLLHDGLALPIAVPPMPSADDVVRWLCEPTVLAALAWTGVVTTAVTIAMEAKAMETLSAAETTLIYSTEPLWGSLWAALFFGERFGVGAGVGAALILGGCTLSSWDFGGGERE